MRSNRKLTVYLLFNMRAAVYLEVMAIAGDCLRIQFEGCCLPGDDGYIAGDSLHIWFDAVYLEMMAIAGDCLV